jgi:hypothetical protein
MLSYEATSVAVRMTQDARMRLALLLAATALVGGCGDGRPERVPVAGHVTIDGQPLERGNIRFHVKDHRPASAALGPGGSFRLTTYELNDGCVLGTHEVTVTAVEVINANTERWLAPKKYSQVATSGLSYTVEETTETAAIELTWDGGKPFMERIQGRGD